MYLHGTILGAIKFSHNPMHYQFVSAFKTANYMRKSTTRKIKSISTIALMMLLLG
jgi:hypothetical protein